MSSNNTDLRDSMVNYDQCLDHANGTSTYLDVPLKEMSREDLLAVIGHMALATERDKQRLADYIHSSAVSRARGGLTPRSPTHR